MVTLIEETMNQWAEKFSSDQLMRMIMNANEDKEDSEEEKKDSKEEKKTIFILKKTVE
jgi:hypothetical protein